MASPPHKHSQTSMKRDYGIKHLRYSSPLERGSRRIVANHVFTLSHHYPRRLIKVEIKVGSWWAWPQKIIKSSVLFTLVWKCILMSRYSWTMWMHDIITMPDEIAVHVYCYTFRGTLSIVMLVNMVWILQGLLQWSSTCWATVLVFCLQSSDIQRIAPCTPQMSHDCRWVYTIDGCSEHLRPCLECENYTVSCKIIAKFLCSNKP